MKYIRFYLALFIAKCCYYGLRMFGKRASQHPGWLALGVCPNFFELAPKAKLCIAVTGTNGKTTVANLLTDALQESGLKVVSNREGANVDCGCATNIVNSLTFFGKVKVDATVFEVDERFSRVTLPGICPDYLVVTNLFRDSLKRNAHPDYIFNIINTYCPNHTHLILNADDLGSNLLKPNNKHTYFAVGKQEEDQNAYESLVMDHSICPNCHSQLKYQYRHYHHIGKTYCTKCGYESPCPDALVEKIDAQNGQLYVNLHGNQVAFPLMSDILFNVYNQIAIITLLDVLGFEVAKIQNIFAKIHIPDSRLNQIDVNGTKVIQAMSKGQSCVSSSRTFDLVASKEGNKLVILVLDDAYDRKNSIEYWGWIYDTDYERLAKDNIKIVAPLGPRCYDHEVRLLLAGVPQDRIYAKSKELEAIDTLPLEEIDSIFILYDTSTYHLSCEIKEKIIKRLEAK